MRTRPIVLTFGLLTGLFAAGYGVMFTVLDDFRDEFGIGEGALGLVVAMGFFSSFLAQLLIAPLADRGHARRLVRVGMFLNIGGLFAMAVSQSVMPLLASRFVMGLGAGMAVPAVRRIVILAEPDQLGHNLGRLLAADVAGFAAGPAISAVLVGPLGLPAPFLVIAIATVLCLPVIARVRVDESADAPRARLAFDLLRIRPYAAAVVMGAALFLMIGTFDSLWVLVHSDLGTVDWLANAGISLFAVPFIFLSAVGGRTAQRLGPFRFATAGLVLGAACMVAYGHAGSGIVMLLVAVPHALGDGFTVPSTGVAVGMVAPAERQAGAQGLLGGVQTLTGGLTAVAAGWLYESHGRTVAYTACAAAMLLLVVVGMALAGPSWRLRGASEGEAEPALVG